MQRDEHQHKSALIVNEGIPQPPSVNIDSVARFKASRKKRFTIDEYVDGILASNRTILSQAITQVESNLPDHQIVAQKIIEKCLPHAGKSIRIGITGVPGAGKSSFIETFGTYITSLGHKLAVLAIDPSSERSKGSILGDKTRMEQLSANPNAFIRPSPSSGSLGGVARKTRETVCLCEAAGFDVIFIETVGVGQSETAVHSMVDFFLLLAIAGAGDELQGIKRGIMEMADSIVVTKADGSNIDKANRAKAEHQSALHLMPLSESGWQPKVLTCSAHQNTGITEIWDIIQEFQQLTKNNGFFISNRAQQSKYWMHQTIQNELKSRFYQQHSIASLLKKMEHDVVEGKISSFEAAHYLLEEYYKK
jgi:LAO/AO transport system kinase